MLIMDIDMGKNRDKVKQIKKGTFWCFYCDSNLVVEDKKCSVCGKRNGISRRFKKYSPQIDDHLKED